MVDSELIVRPLITTSPLEQKHQYIKTLEDRCRYVKELLMKDPDVTRAVQNTFQVIAADEGKVRGLQQGLFCLALTESSHCSAVVNSCVILTRDNMRSLLTELDFIVVSIWPRLLQEIRVNIVHFLTELLPNCNDLMADNVVINLMRRLITADFSDENVTLCNLFFRMVEKLRGWFEAHKEIHGHLMLGTLRLLIDFYELNHLKASTVNLATMRLQISLVDHFMRNHFVSSAKGGRDILRLLLHSARIPEVQSLVHDLLHRPTFLNNPKDVALLFEAAPKEITVSLLSHDLERWVRYVALECLDRPNSSLRRHLEFLIKRHFSTPCFYLLIPHVIRYIICNIAPENSKLQPPYYQRWAFCLNLIDICTNHPHAFANAKLALVLDWIFFTPGTCIMLIEPAMLAIYRNVHVKTNISITLLQFMFLTIRRLYPPLSPNMRKSMQCAIADILKMRVVPDLLSLAEGLWKYPKLFAEFEVVFSRKLVGGWVDICRSKYTTKVSVQRKLPLPVVEANGSSSAGSSASSSSSTATSDAAAFKRSTSTESLPSRAVVSSSTSSPATVVPSIPVLPKPGVTAEVPATGTAESPIVVNGGMAAPSDAAPVRSVPPRPAVKASPTLPDVASFLTEDAMKNDGLSNIDESPLALNHTQMYCKRSSLTAQELATFIQEFPSTGLRTCLQHLSDACAIRSSSTPAVLPLMPANVHRYRQEQGEAICLSMQNLLQQMMEDLELLTSTPSSGSSSPSESSSDGEVLNGVRSGGADGERSGSGTRTWLNRLAHVVVNLCLPWLRGSLLPAGKRTDEALKESIASPIFMIMRTMSEMSRNDPNRHFFGCFLCEMHKFVPRIGYYFLYYLTIGHRDFLAYREFCEILDGDGFFKKVVADLRLVGNESPNVMTFILPVVYSTLYNELGGKFEFLDSFLPRMDGSNMLELLGQVVLEHVNFFPTDEILNEALMASLRLDTWSQYQFWQIINAHEIPTEKFIPFIAKLEVGKHDEAISHLLIMLKMDRPSESLLRMLYNRCADSEDLLTMSILHFWSISSTTEMKLADVTLALTKSNIKLMERNHEKEKKKRKDEYPLPPLRKILKFLDLIRVKCSNIISGGEVKQQLQVDSKDQQRCHLLLQNTSIQQALQLVSAKAVESLKEEFSELLALAEDVEDEESKSTVTSAGRSLRNLSVRKAAKAEKRLSSDRRPASSASSMGTAGGNSGSDSGSDEEYMDFQPKKKKIQRLDFD